MWEGATTCPVPVTAASASSKTATTKPSLPKLQSVGGSHDASTKNIFLKA